MESAASSRLDFNPIKMAYPNLKKEFKAYEQEVSKIARRKNAIRFLNRCKEDQILPKHLRFRSPLEGNRAKTIMTNAGFKILKEEIKESYLFIKSAEEKAARLYAFLKCSMDPSDFRKFIYIMDGIFKNVNNKTFLKLEKKFEELTQENLVLPKDPKLHGKPKSLSPLSLEDKENALSSSLRVHFTCKERGRESSTPKPRGMRRINGTNAKATRCFLDKRPYLTRPLAPLENRPSLNKPRENQSLSDNNVSTLSNASNIFLNNEASIGSNSQNRSTDKISMEALFSEGLRLND